MRAEANVLAEAFETGYIAAKEHIPQHATRYTLDEVYFRTFETFDGAGLIRVNVEDHHRCLDWEIKNEFVGF